MLAINFISIFIKPFWGPEKFFLGLKWSSENNQRRCDFHDSLNISVKNKNEKSWKVLDFPLEEILRFYDRIMCFEKFFYTWIQEKSSPIESASIKLWVTLWRSRAERNSSVFTILLRDQKIFRPKSKL